MRLQRTRAHPRTHVRSAYYRPTCYLDIIQGVLTLKFYSAPEPNLPLQQLQLVPTLLSPQHPPPLTSVNFTSLFIILRSLSQINENIWQTDPTQVIQYYCFNVSLYFSFNAIFTLLCLRYIHHTREFEWRGGWRKGGGAVGDWFYRPVR